MKRREQTPTPPRPAALSRNWLSTVSDCLAQFQREQIGAENPVVDTEIGGGPRGGPDDAVIWLICRSRGEKMAFVDADLPRATATLRQKLIDAGIPDAAVASIAIRATSRDEFMSR